MRYSRNVGIPEASRLAAFDPNPRLLAVDEQRNGVWDGGAGLELCPIDGDESRRSFARGDVVFPTIRTDFDRCGTVALHCSQVPTRISRQVVTGHSVGRLQIN